MANSVFVHGKLHTPYFIFVRCAGVLSDADLLNRFDLSRYKQRPSHDAPDFGPYAILADAAPWKLVADDWLYTLWHKPTTRPAIAELGKRYDVFACSVGDCDHSFDFFYYHNSELVRKYVVDDPDFQGGKVVENVGSRLPGEAAAFKHEGEQRIVLAIAASLGIKTDYTEPDIRIYAPRKRGFSF